MRPCPTVDQGLMQARSGASLRMGSLIVVLGSLLTAWPRAGAGQETAGPSQDLSTRYRFQEHYATGDGQKPAGSIGTYRVGVKAINKITEEQAQGAPKITQTSLQFVYTERAMSANTLNDQYVTDLVRRFDTVRTSAESSSATKGKSDRPLEGVTVWLKDRPQQLPLVLNLTPEHRLTDLEYNHIINQIWLPRLAFLLPDSPKRLHEAWRVIPTAGQQMLGKPFQSGVLQAKLTDVKPDPKGGDWTATIRVTGQIVLGSTDTGVNAEFTFTFAPPAPGGAAGAAASEKQVVDARGAITKMRIASTSSALIPEQRVTGRLKFTVQRDYTLERQLNPTGPPLDPPAKAPQASEENSWLTYRDPKGQFEFRHSEDLHYMPDEPDSGPESLIFRSIQSEGSVRVGIHLVHQTKNQAEVLRKDQIAGLEKADWEITPGSAAWLPEGDWGKLRVFRWELVGQTPSGERLHLYSYSVLTGQNLSFFVESTTNLDPPTVARSEIESILKTLTLAPERK
jgi:hypothetical protein